MFRQLASDARYVNQGDPISAREYNKLVRSTRSYNMSAGHQVFFNPGMVRFETDETVQPFQILEITGCRDFQALEPVYTCRKYQANQTPIKTFLVNGHVPVAPGFFGEGYIPEFGPVIIDPSPIPSANVGDIVGPYHDSFQFQTNKPGFVIIGKQMFDNTDDYWVAIRQGGPAYGNGTAKAGQAADADPIILQNVSFDSGWDCWDGSSDFPVRNIFSDEVFDGQYVMFKWKLDTAEWVTTDVACPPDSVLART